MKFAILFDVVAVRPCLVVPSKRMTITEAQKLPEVFMLRDGDGVDMFIGRAERKDFEPLDFALEDYGCTSIWYRNEVDQWIEL